MFVVQGEDGVDVTHAILGPLHAVHTLRIDSFQDYSAAAMCATVLISMAHRPMTTRILHLALHGLTLPPTNPELVTAIQEQSHLVVSCLQTAESQRSCCA